MNAHEITTAGASTIVETQVLPYRGAPPVELACAPEPVFTTLLALAYEIAGSFGNRVLWAQTRAGVELSQALGPGNFMNRHIFIYERPDDSSLWTGEIVLGVRAVRPAIARGTGLGLLAADVVARLALRLEARVTSLRRGFSTDPFMTTAAVEVGRIVFSAEPSLGPRRRPC